MDGVKTSNQPYNVFINATIIVSPDKKIEKGILIERDGLVVEVGKILKYQKIQLYMTKQVNIFILLLLIYIQILE